MASTTMNTISAKVKSSEKSLFTKTCDDIGTSPSNAIRMFISAFNKRGGFPFDTANPYGFNEETLKEIEYGQDILDGKLDVPTYDSTEDLLRAAGA